MVPAPTETDDETYIRISMSLPEKINKCIFLYAQDYLKDTRIKAYQVPYIIFLKGKPGSSQRELKEFIAFDKSRISVVVRELIAEGFVEDKGTGRNSSLHLTERGLNAFCICKMFMQIVRREIFNVGAEKEEQLKKSCMELNAHLDEILAKYNKA